MLYIRTTPDLQYPYSPAQLRAAHPAVSFPRTPDAALLAEWDVYPVAYTPRPEHDPLTERVTEAAPVQVDGQWQQAWQVSPLSESEQAQALQARREAMVCTVRQAREQLIQMGLLADVDAAIAAIPDPLERAKALNYWEYSSDFARLNPVMLAIADALGFDDAALDAAFEEAMRR